MTEEEFKGLLEILKASSGEVKGRVLTDDEKPKWVRLIEKDIATTRENERVQRECVARALREELTKDTISESRREKLEEMLKQYEIPN